MKDKLIPLALRANIIVLLLICSCSNSNKITGSWRVIDEALAGENEYRKIYTFSKDSVKINELGHTIHSYPVKYTRNKIYVDTVLEFNYQKKEGELILSKPIKTIPGRYDSMTLIPFSKKSKDEININSIKSLLPRYTWDIMLYDSRVTLKTSFYDTLCYKSKVCPADVFNFQGSVYNRSLGDDVNWWIAEFDGQLFLIIESLMGDIYPTVYLILEATSDKLILEYTWNNDQEQVEMLRGDLIHMDNDRNVIENHLVGKWIQQKANFVTQNMTLDVDTTGVEVPRFSVALFTPDSNLVYKESDFYTNDFRVEFKETGRFNYYLEEYLICEGYWILSKDIRFVKLTSEYDIKNFEKYTPECDDIFLEHLSNDSIVFQQNMPYYYNDTLVLKEPMRFFMKRSN